MTVEMPMAAYAPTRTCKDCLVEKSTEQNFRLHKTYRNGKRYTSYGRSCLDCTAAEKARWEASRDPADAAAAMHKGNLARYGLTPLHYAEMLLEQNGVCAICDGPQQGDFRMAVDHDHKTGEVRGLLCTHCNHGIGKFRDDPKLMMAAVAYLLKAGG